MRPPNRGRGALLALVTACSGFAGLGYEVVWTRMLSAALGAETAAVLGVVAGFFAGLAAGAFLLDGPIRRAARPARAYALLELVIAGWSCVSIALLPALTRALPPLLGTAPPPLLHWAAAFAVPALALLPATAAMGGTLIALERLASAQARGARMAAAVYGANTAGAVAGALAGVFVLMPAFGLSGTLAALALVNLACAGMALRTGPAPAAAPAPAPGRDVRLAATLAATGFIGVAFEIAAVRLAAQMLQDTIYSFACLLAAYLLGAAAGALIWQRAGRGAGFARGLAWLLAAAALSGLATAALLPWIAEAAAAGAGEFAVAAMLLLAPSAAMGALFGHLAQAVRDRRGSLGQATGVNALGAACAPAAAALALIPAVGARGAAIVVSLAYLALLPPAAGRRALTWASLPALAFGATLLARPASLVRVPEGGAVLAAIEGPTAAASVVEDADGLRYLEVNGHFRMGGAGSARSDWRQALIPLLLQPSPRRALFLGVGAGATLWGAAHVPGVQATGVELAPEAAALLPWFAEPPAADDPATPALVIADARRYVAADAGEYDAIVADLFHPALDGSGALYATEHFAAVRERLAPNGVFCQWLPLYQLDLPSLRAIAASFLRVFPGGSAWLAHDSVRTPMLALIAARDGAVRADPAALSARLADPALRPALERTGLTSAMDLLGLFVADPAALARFADDAAANTDDRPFVALDARRNVAALAAHPARTLLAVLGALRADPAALLGSRAPQEQSARLVAYWRARDRFIEAGAALPSGLQGRALIDAASPGLLDAVRDSAEFEPAYAPLLAMAQALLGTDRAAGRSLLTQLDAAAPSRPEARELLQAAP